MFNGETFMKKDELGRVGARERMKQSLFFFWLWLARWWHWLMYRRETYPNWHMCVNLDLIWHLHSWRNAIYLWPSLCICVCVNFLGFYLYRRTYSNSDKKVKSLKCFLTGNDRKLCQEVLECPFKLEQ